MLRRRQKRAASARAQRRAAVAAELLEGIEFGDCGAYDSYEDDVDPEQEGDVEIRAAGEVGAGEGKFLSAAE